MRTVHLHQNSLRQKNPLMSHQPNNLFLNNEVSTTHLLKACGEAMDNQDKEFLEVILKQLEKKACMNGRAAQHLVIGHLVT